MSGALLGQRMDKFLKKSVARERDRPGEGQAPGFKFYEDEGHGVTKVQNRVDAYRRSVAFLGKYLLG